MYIRVIARQSSDILGHSVESPHFSNILADSAITILAIFKITVFTNFTARQVTVRLCKISSAYTDANRLA